MANRLTFTEEQLADLAEFGNQKPTGGDYRRYLCVFMRVAYGMCAAEIAKVVGWCENRVRIIQGDFAKDGVATLVEKKRGGRNHARMTPEEEAEFLAGFFEKAKNGQILVIAEIQAALAERLGKPVHSSGVYRMLHRHGWRKMVPRPFHPKRNPEAAEAFKKGGTQMRSGQPQPRLRLRASLSV